MILWTRPPANACRIALRPTARAVEWMAPLGSAAVSLGVVGYAAVRSGGAPDAGSLTPLRLAMVALAAGAATAVDDPAAPTLAASPLPLGARRALQLGLVATAWLLAWAAALGAASWLPSRAPAAQLTLEAVGWLAIGLAVAVRFGSTASAPALLVLVVLVGRLPDRVALLTAGDRWSALQLRWVGIVLAAVTIVAWSSRDPARVRRRPGEPAR